MQQVKRKSVSSYHLFVWLIVRGGWVGAWLGFLLVPVIYTVAAWIDPYARNDFLITLLQLLCYIAPFSALTGAALGTALNFISGVIIYFAMSKSHGNLTRLKNVTVGTHIGLCAMFLIILSAAVIRVKEPIPFSGMVFLFFTFLVLVSLWYLLVSKPFFEWYKAYGLVRKQPPQFRS